MSDTIASHQRAGTSKSQNSPHRFKVKCAACHKFLKWGTNDQLKALHETGGSFDTVEYKAPKSIF